MRSFLLPSLLALLAGLQPGYGQLKYGIHAGIGMSNMSDINDPPPALDVDFYDAAFSFFAGVFGEVELSGKFALFSELNYERRGADYVAFESDHTVRFHYLSIPLQVQYSFQNDINVKLGPQLNYAVSIDSDRVSNAFLDEIYDDFDIGINLGVAYPIWEKLAVAARYYHGLTSLETFLYAETAEFSEEIDLAKNRHWAIGLQYYLH